MELILISIFLFVYVLIIIVRWHRTSIVFFFSTILIILGFLTPKEAWNFVDFNTLGLLLGMMIMVSFFKRTGLFEFLAIKSVKVARGNIFILFVLFFILTGVVSSLLDNVTTVLLITPVSILVADMIGVSPYPFLVGEILSSNIGGTATLIGDPPNIMIGSATGLSFIDFLLNLGPVVIIISIVVILYFKFVVGKRFSLKGSFDPAIVSLEPQKAIKDWGLLKRTLSVFTLVLLGFFTHDLLNIPPSIVALFGASLLLILTKVHPEDYLKEVEWTTLFFFAGLFILVGALENAGIMEMVSEHILNITSNFKLLVFIILLTSAVISGIIDNIPFVAATIPVIFSIMNKMHYPNSEVLWWALALGSCLGGNATLIGASANVVVAGISEKTRTPVTFRNYLRHGIPVTIISIVISALYLYLRYLI